MASLDAELCTSEARTALSSEPSAAASQQQAAHAASAVSGASGRASFVDTQSMPTLWPPCSSCKSACKPPLQLLSSFPRRQWAPRDGPVPSDEFHWGQRKLLMSEVAFLTQHAQAGDTVLYVGAAPGEHIILLACTLFPHLTFHCVDPRPMAFGSPAPEQLDGAARSPVNVTQEQGFFTSASAQHWQYSAEANTGAALVISDLRNTQDEHSVQADMQLQADIVRAIKPRAALLKFRLPWGSGKTEYLPGSVWLQPYAQGRSTETRLWVTQPSGTCSWDHSEYEDRLFWFNTQLRAQYGSSREHRRRLGGGGLPACWDGWAEVAIWEGYLRSQHPKLARACAHGSSAVFTAGLQHLPVRTAVWRLAWEATSLLASYRAAESNREVWLKRAQIQRKRQHHEYDRHDAKGESVCWTCGIASGTAAVPHCVLVAASPALD